MTLEERGPSELLSFLQQLDSYLESDRHQELYLGGGAAILLAYEGYDYDEREKMDRSFQIVEVQFLGLEPTELE